MRFFSFIFSLLITFALFSQTENNKTKIDSLKAQLKSDSLKIFHFQKFRFCLTIDNRNSFIRNRPVNLNGIQIGVIYKEQHNFGVGFYNLTASSKIKTASKQVDKDGIILQTLNMSYFTFFYQPVLIDKKKFELDLPLEIGLGRFVLNRQDSASGQRLTPINSGIVPFGIGIMPIYKPWKWVGVSYLLGFRYAKASDINFSGAYYSFGLWLDVREIIRETRFYLVKKKKFKKEIRKLTV